MPSRAPPRTCWPRPSCGSWRATGRSSGSTSRASTSSSPTATPSGSRPFRERHEDGSGSSTPSRPTSRSAKTRSRRRRSWRSSSRCCGRNRKSASRLQSGIRLLVSIRRGTSHRAYHCRPWLWDISFFTVGRSCRLGTAAGPGDTGRSSRPARCVRRNRRARDAARSSAPGWCGSSCWRP